MFARTVSLHLKANSAAEFTKTLESQIIPLLRKQKGFRDEITLLTQGGKQAVAMSFWDTKENADAYEKGTYPEVLTALAKAVEGTPKVESYEVSNSTAHKIAARAA
jgi:heme-degrading monooxygenase HmoA